MDKNKIIFELVIGVIFLVIIFSMSGHLDVLENLAEWSREYEEYELDEILIVSVSGVFMLLLFSIRRIQELKFKTKELLIALNEIETLKGIIPICSNCKEMRDEKGVWNSLEIYIHSHSNAKLSARVCPKCIDEKFNLQNDVRRLKHTKHGPLNEQLLD